MPSQTFSASGTFNVPAGVSVVQCQAWGEGRNGSNGTGISAGSGGGGGEFAAENSLSVTPGGTLTITIGTGGTGTNTTVTGGSVTVTAHASTGTSGGTGSTNSVHFNGGAAASAGGSGGGGGSSAGTASAGGNATGSTGGTAPSGGGNGGNGGTGSGAGTAGSVPGGGGGGGGSSGTGGGGAHGQVIITWTAPPSTFTAPSSARGRRAAVRGSWDSSPGAKLITFPSPFQLPVRPSRGGRAAIRGHGGNTAGQYTAPPPVVVSPFTLPTRPARGQAARPGSSASTPGAPFATLPSPFTLPAAPAQGATGTRRGSSDSSPGAPFVLIQTSPFTLPKAPARGRSATPRTGRGTSSPGARFVLIRISPFTLPKGPAKGRSKIRRGSWSAGSATGKGAPVTPRRLIIAIASAAGTDDYGNAFPQGVYVGGGAVQVGDNSATAQVKLVPGNVSGIQFPIPAAGLGNTPNVEAGTSGGTPTLAVSGPGQGTAGAKDWVQLLLWGNDEAGDEARLEFRYVTTAGGVQVQGSYDGTGWTFPAHVNDSGGLLVGTSFECQPAAQFDSSASFNGQVVVNNANLFVGDGSSAQINLNPVMASPVNWPTAGKTLAQTQACLDAFIQSFKNRGMVNP